MSILNIFRRREKTMNVLQHASATLYPDKILIQTYDRAKEAFWLGTTDLTFLENDADDALLGSTIRHHMKLTRTGQIRPSDWKAAHKLFLKAAGFKTQKEEYKDAKNVNISRKETQLTISISTNGEYNGKTRGFWGNGELLMDNAISDAELGKHVREAWVLCS